MTSIDDGLLSPLTVGVDSAVADSAVLDALVTAEVALVRALGTAGFAPAEVVEAVSNALDWQGSALPCRGHGLALEPLAAAGVHGGNPVIPLVGAVRAAVPEAARPWVHRGATSQDVLDTALMLVSRAAAMQVVASLRATETGLAALAAEHRDLVAAGRTLTQHGVPTTVGLRAANRLRAVRRAAARLQGAAEALPAQLGGAGGTLASFVELALGRDSGGGQRGDVDEGQANAAVRVHTLVAAFAAETGLAAPDAPWHVTRWPVTELGDALVQAVDALGALATDVATLSRTEIAEVAEGTGGGSSAMPQKHNPVGAVLVRSAAMRAPQLGATLHLAAAMAGDERPDGAWHAEWPTLRELLRVALGAAARGAELVTGLRVDAAAVARNLDASRGLIVAERLSLVLGPVLGASAVSQIVAEVSAGAALADVVEQALAAAGISGIDVARLVNPHGYTGLAGALVDDALRPSAAGAQPELAAAPAPDAQSEPATEESA